jgi:hypothetical protein
MKKRKIFHRLFVSFSFVLFSALVFTACQRDDENNNRSYFINGNADGSQMVPPVKGAGMAIILGIYSQRTGQLITITSWSGLTGGPISGGFYTGARETNGSIVGKGWALGSGLTGTGSFNDTMIITTDQAVQLTSNNWYYLLETADNPHGEVRGQITAIVQ